MNFLKDLFVDSLNGFSPRFIPFFLLQLLSAGLLAHLLQKMLNTKFKGLKFGYFALIAVAVALLVALSKNSLMLAVIAAAILIAFVRLREKSSIELIGYFVVGLIGLGCGCGSIIQTLIGSLILFCVILFTPLKE